MGSIVGVIVKGFCAHDRFFGYVRGVDNLRAEWIVLWETKDSLEVAYIPVMIKKI